MTIEGKYLNGYHEFTASNGGETKFVKLEGNDLDFMLAGLRVNVSDEETPDYDSRGKISVEVTSDNYHSIFHRGNISAHILEDAATMAREKYKDTVYIGKAGTVSFIVRNGREQGIAEFTNTK